MSELSVAERWLPIPGHDGYEASDHGRVRSVDRVIRDSLGRVRRLRGYVLSPVLAGSRDPRWTVTLNGQRRRWVHRLVLSAFVGECPPGQEGCHDNGDPFDNRLGNLYWGTHSQNMLDKQRHGTDQHRNRTHCPREHLLKTPNLVACEEADGHRQCLACNRATATCQRAEQRGQSLDFRETSDWHYRMIMSI